MMTGKHRCLCMFRPGFDKYMMKNNLDKIAKDLYGKIQVRFPDIKIGDENAEVLSKKSEIPLARFFEFDYVEGKKTLGTVAITLDEDDGIVVQISGDLSDVKTSHNSAYKFIRSFRKFAKTRMLNFDVQNIGKSNLDKRDYQFQAKKKESTMMESKMFGTSRISYQDLGEARLIVKHNKPVNEHAAAGRSMNIASIYVENADGERFKYPYKHLSGARALAEHIKHGGNPYDSIGKHITGLSEELNQLRKFKGHVSRQEQLSEAMGAITDKVLERIEEVKKEVSNLQRSAFYEQFAESYQAKEEKLIPEEIMNDWVDRLTVRTFNEEMKAVFPYLYNIMDESELPVRELSADDLLDEGSSRSKQNWFPTLNSALEAEGLTEFWPVGENISYDETARVNYEDETGHPRVMVIYRNENGMYERPVHYDTKARPRKRKNISPENQFESFLESIVSEDMGGFGQDDLKKLNNKLQFKLSGGQNGILNLKGLPFPPEVMNIISDISYDDKEAEDVAIRDIIRDYILDHSPESVASLQNLSIAEPADVGGPTGGQSSETPPTPSAEEMPPAPPAEEMPPAPPMGETPPAGMPGTPPPPQPMAESAVKAAKLIKMKEKFKNARTKGATIKTPFSEGMTIGDAMRECGINPMECGYEEEYQNDADSDYELMEKFVSGFFNREEGNFPLGGQGIITKVQKFADEKGCSEDALAAIIDLINEKDPSHGIPTSDESHEHSQEQHDIFKLAGINDVEPEITVVKLDNSGDKRADSLLKHIKHMQETPIMEGTIEQIKRNAGLL